jgi:hypothetical protein
MRDLEAGIQAALRQEGLEPKPRWLDSLGREVDLDNIDREYALNILTMVLLRRGRGGYTDAEIREDALVQKLREVVLTGREPNHEDRRRAFKYNIDNIKAGKRFRAPVR